MVTKYYVFYFFKLCKWYQIALCTTYRKQSFDLHLYMKCNTGQKLVNMIHQTACKQIENYITYCVPKDDGFVRRTETKKTKVALRKIWIHETSDATK